MKLYSKLKKKKKATSPSMIRGILKKRSNKNTAMSVEKKILTVKII